MVLVGCDRASRHKVLTFFFEGVPPLDSQQQAVDSGTTAEETPTIAVADEQAVMIARQTDASRHAPAKDCETCHLAEGAWNQKRLVSPLPDLCYSCHTDYGAGEYVHGPVAVGECVFCHEPHQSRYVHLQKAPQPKLCYQCHDREDIESLVDHQDRLDQVCSECHDPHTSSAKHLLTWDSQAEAVTNSVDSSK